MFALALERFAIPGQQQSGYELWLQLSVIGQCSQTFSIGSGPNLDLKYLVDQSLD